MPNDELPSGETASNEVVRKATAVLLREGAEGREVLVFLHPDMDGSGSTVQLPAGTVEDGESYEEAALRELAEETGVMGAVVVAWLGAFDGAGAPRGAIHGQPPQHREVFHLAPTLPPPDRWASVCDCGADLECYWLPLATAELHPLQQPWLDLARAVLAGGNA